MLVWAPAGGGPAPTPCLVGVSLTCGFDPLPVVAAYARGVARLADTSLLISAVLDSLDEAREIVVIYQATHLLSAFADLNSGAMGFVSQLAHRGLPHIQTGRWQRSPRHQRERARRTLNSGLPSDAPAPAERESCSTPLQPDREKSRTAASRNLLPWK